MDTTFQLGERVIWLRATNKGYGGVHHIAALFVGFQKKKVIIDALLTNGGTRRHSVRVDSIRKG